MIQSTTDSLPDVRGTSHSRYAPCLTSFIVILFSPQSSSASPMIVDQELLLPLAPVTGKAEDFTLTTDIETTAPNGTLFESECSLYSKKTSLSSVAFVPSPSVPGEESCLHTFSEEGSSRV